MRGINAYRAAVDARTRARASKTQEKGWEIETLHQPTQSGMPISLHAGGHFRRRNPRGRRNEMLASHRRIVENLADDEIAQQSDSENASQPVQIFPPLSEGIICNNFHA